MKLAQFITTLLFVLTLLPGGAHVLELPAKMALDRDTYMTVQQIYQGWNLLGILFIAALVSGAVLTIMSHSQRPPFWLALAVTALIGASLAVFFAWTFPVNVATSNWTVEPGNWMALRRQWEYSYAGNTALVFIALCCVTGSCLSWKKPRQ